MGCDCNKCGKHCLDCKCPIILLRKFISKKEAKKMFPSTNEKEEIQFTESSGYEVMHKYEIAKQAYKEILEAIVEIEEKHGILCDLPPFIEVGEEKFYKNDLHHFLIRRNREGKIKIE